MIVIDAGALARVLIVDDTEGDIARRRVRHEQIVAPEIVYLEVASVIRRFVRAGSIDGRRAQQAVDDLMDAPMHVARHRWLLPRMWELRENLSSCDAAYVALAEASDCPLLTTDARMARAPGPRCRFEVLGDG